MRREKGKPGGAEGKFAVLNGESWWWLGDGQRGRACSRTAASGGGWAVGGRGRAAIGRARRTCGPPARSHGARASVSERHRGRSQSRRARPPRNMHGAVPANPARRLRKRSRRRRADGRRLARAVVRSFACACRGPPSARVRALVPSLRTCDGPCVERGVKIAVQPSFRGAHARALGGVVSLLGAEVVEAITSAVPRVKELLHCPAPLNTQAHTLVRSP